MGSSRTFYNVSASIWECVKSTSNKEHGTVYNPPDANQGTATTSTPIGDIVLSFNFDPGQASVAYKIEKKPFIVSDNQIWDGIEDSINGCKK